jgi:hypothetical protein
MAGVVVAFSIPIMIFCNASRRIPSFSLNPLQDGDVVEDELE